MSELEPTITQLEPTATERLRALLDALYIGDKGTRWEGWSVAKDAAQDYVWE